MMNERIMYIVAGVNKFRKQRLLDQSRHCRSFLVKVMVKLVNGIIQYKYVQKLAKQSQVTNFFGKKSVIFLCICIDHIF